MAFDNALLFGLTLFLGFVATEGTVEYLLGTPFDKFPKLTPFKWLLMYVSLAVGVLFAFFYALDVVAAWFGGPVTNVGVAITGIIIGRGANFVSEVWQKFFPPKKSQ